ncbi:MAG TPA: sigma-54-dependent Fis family transcriptional regulator, partial [Candidatus Aminicenantes bacterium]|nr:sigma-54-dependent Fis family transcriptional regulator [Candidatus Aminicenantes bacterium]
MDKILVLDDERSLCELLKVVFQKEGYEVLTTPSAKKAIEIAQGDDIDVVVSDIKLPEMNGLEVLKRLRKIKPELPVLMITAYGTIKEAVEALKMGAYDYIIKPFDVEELKVIVAKALETKRLQDENVRLRKELKDKYSLESMIGKSKKMQEIYSLIEKIAPTETTVLIQGESGTGKEMAARAIHYLSLRREKPFVTINCGALPESLLESELFGHVKGAFTDAVTDKKGMFEVADKGTLFLDEVGEMSPITQVKLLRTLQERKIRRVGGTEEIPIDVRIISATNQDLKKKIKEGFFREDLYYRLNVLSLEMPPLRERKEDIPLLVNHFLQKYCQKLGRGMKRVAPEVYNIFESYPWPGNIRELENVIERVVAIEERETITTSCLPKELLQPEKREIDLEIKPGFRLNETIEAITRDYVQKALEMSRGKLKEAAELLGVNYRSIRYLVDKFDLKA